MRFSPGCSCCALGDNWCSKCTNGTSPDQIEIVLSGFGNVNCSCCGNLNDSFVLSRYSTACQWTASACSACRQYYLGTFAGFPGSVAWTCTADDCVPLLFQLIHRTVGGVTHVTAQLVVTMSSEVIFYDLGLYYTKLHIYTYEYDFGAVSTINCETDLDALALTLVGYTTTGTNAWATKPCDETGTAATVYPIYT